MASARDFIHIHRLAVDCIIGIYPRELEQEQRLYVDLRIGTDVTDAGRSGRIRDTCDYEQAANQIAALLEFRRFRLLEAAAEEISAMLFGAHPEVQSLQLRIEKPQALMHRAECAAVEVSRERIDYPRHETKTDFGALESMLETRDAGVYLAHLRPGKELCTAALRVERGVVWLVAGGVDTDNGPMKRSTAASWASGHAPVFRNTPRKGATMLVVTCPAMMVSLTG